MFKLINNKMSKKLLPSNSSFVYRLRSRKKIVVPSLYTGKLADVFNDENGYYTSVKREKHRPSAKAVLSLLEEDYPVLRPTILPTGIKLSKAKNKALLVTTAEPAYCKNGLMVAGGSMLVSDDREIKIPVYNTQTLPIVVKSGNIIAEAIAIRGAID